MGVSDAQFSEFVAARWSALFRTSFLMTGDVQLAEELAQESLVKVYAARGRVADVGALESYCRRTLAHEYVNEIRRLARARATAVASPASPDPGDDVASRETLRRALASLPRGQRAVIVMRFFDDMPVADVAAALGCSVGSVKKQTHRALAKLERSVHDSDTVDRTTRHA